MELIKTNILLILASFCLLIMLTIIIFNPKNTISLEDLNGKWTSFYKNSKIIFVINQNKTCSLEFQDLNLTTKRKINGKCDIDFTKVPNTLIITKIPEISTSLYSLILPINKNIIHVSSFSTKWKLRPITFTQDNKIIFKKS